MISGDSISTLALFLLTDSAWSRSNFCSRPSFSGSPEGPPFERRNINTLFFNKKMWSWELKLRTKRGVSKIRQMSGPFQNLIAGGTRSLVRKRSQEKHLCQLVTCLLCQDHLPAKRCSRSQICVKPELRVSVRQELRRQEC